VEAQIHAHLAKLGIDEPGRGWILRALHPASEKKSAGLPDASAAYVLRPDFRLTTTIQAPPGASQWDCLIWTVPGDVNCLRWAAGPSPVDFSNGAVPGTGSTVTFGSVACQANINQLTQPYQVQLGGSSYSAITAFPAMQPAAFRHQFMSVTATLIASAVSDQGQVYAGQLPPFITDAGLMQPTGYDSGIRNPDSGSGANYPQLARLFTTVLPADEVSLSRMNPDYYQSDAREGVYMPLRLAGPSQPFVRCSAGSVITTDTGGGYLATTDAISPIGAILSPTLGLLQANPSLVPWPYRATREQVGSAPAGFANPLLLDSGFDNVNTGVIIFRGLSGTSGGGFAASIQLKVISGLEIAPVPPQGDGVFVEPPAPYQPKALEAYYKLALELKGAYPARFNSLETILDAIGDVASKVWSHVEPRVVGALQGLADTGLSMLSGAVGRRMGALGVPRVAYRAPSVARSMTRSVASAKRLVARPKPKRRGP